MSNHPRTQRDPFHVPIRQTSKQAFNFLAACGFPIRSFANSRARYHIVPIVRSFFHSISSLPSVIGTENFSSKSKRFSLETHKYLSFLHHYNYAIEIKANMFLKRPPLGETKENVIEWGERKNFNNHSTADPSGRSSLRDESQQLEYLLVCVCLSNFVLIIIARHIVTVS